MDTHVEHILQTVLSTTDRGRRRCGVAKPRLGLWLRAETSNFFCVAKGAGEKHLNLEIQPESSITLHHQPFLLGL